MILSQYPRPDTWNTRWLQDRERNAMLEAYAGETEGVTYVDTSETILDASPISDGPPPEELFASDRHHLGQEGYAKWHPPIREALRGIVLPNKELMPNPIHPRIGERVLFRLWEPSRDGEP